jgi:ubiquinone biosynthesis accessory factor UbiJ
MLLTPLEALLNRNIAVSSAARGACRKLDGKVLALHVDGLPLSIFMRCADEHMSLTTKLEAANAADATLSGTPLSFVRLAAARPEATLQSGAVRIEGNAEVAQTFRELLQHARPDFEEELSRVVGDVAAHQIGNAARSAFAFGQRAATTLAQNVAEYLQEEGRDLPTRTEADELMADIDKLRDDVARFAARLAIAEKSSGSKP